jgi:hypothetical protein
MTKYRVPLRITFDGFAVVEAVDEEEAETTAVWNLSMNIGSVLNCDKDKISKYYFDPTGYSEIATNESIEEIEEE